MLGSGHLVFCLLLRVLDEFLDAVHPDELENVYSRHSRMHEHSQLLFLAAKFSQ